MNQKTKFFIVITFIALFVTCCNSEVSSIQETDKKRKNKFKITNKIYAFRTLDYLDPAQNRCVSNPIADINSLDLLTSKIMAYRTGAGSLSDAPTPSEGIVHNQGIQRLVLKKYEGVFDNYILVTKSADAPAEPGLEISHIKSSFSSHRMSQNVLVNSTPDIDDQSVFYFEETGSHDHSGGFQVQGENVIIPMETEGDTATAYFIIINLSNPMSPVRRFGHFRTAGKIRNAGAASLTRLSDGRYLAMIFGEHSREGEIFVTRKSCIPGFDGCNGVDDTWESKGNFSSFGSNHHYQNVQFVNDCYSDSQIYAVATHRNTSGNDWVDLWRVDLSLDFTPHFTKVAKSHLYCSNNNSNYVSYCNFSGGAGVYIDPSGNLAIYGVEKYNTGYPGTESVIKFRQF